MCLDKHTTGDGIISALQVLHALRVHKTTLADFIGELTLYPQILINVPIKKGFDFHENSAVQKSLAEAESALNGSGRVLLRPSGTEPVLRVMVEGRDKKQVEQWAKSIADTVRQAAAGN